jgi:hypothetical protein
VGSRQEDKAAEDAANAAWLQEQSDNLQATYKATDEENAALLVVVADIVEAADEVPGPGYIHIHPSGPSSAKDSGHLAGTLMGIRFLEERDIHKSPGQMPGILAQ